MTIFDKTKKHAAPEVWTLFSGSSGNSVYIKHGDTRVLIDVGMSASSMEKALCEVGSSLREINAAFITHEHSDHIRGIGVVTRRYNKEIEIHAASPTSNYIECSSENLKTHAPRYECCIGSLVISSFRTPHDSAMSVGYVIRSDDGFSVGVATDLGCVTDDVLANLVRCGSVVIESNHDVDMLMRGTYPQSLKRRITSRNGHLSNADCSGLVCTLSRSGVENILLAHLSPENNKPALAFEASASELERYNLRHTTVGVAAPYTPTRLI